MKNLMFTADKQLSDRRDIRDGEPHHAAKMRLLLLLPLLGQRYQLSSHVGRR